MSSTDLPKSSWKRETPFRLGELEVFPASGEIRGPAGVERLRPLLMDILVRLAVARGEVVRRETLLEDVWPRRMVNDEVLSRAIAELRTALADDARGARYIETLPKLGYRLVARVEELTPPPAPAAPPAVEAPPPPPPPYRRLLPFASGTVAVAALAALAWITLRPAEPPHVANLGARLTAARPFTSDPALELGPRFSPDGKRVAFALAEGNEARIVVQAIDGSSRQFVGGLEGFARLSPVFFPDGRRIAYWKSGRGDCAIVEHDLESGLEKKLLDCALAPRSRFDLSRDGRRIVFSGNTRPQFPAGLYVMDLEKAAPVALTTPEPGTGDDLFPRFSPDGRRIAFFRGNESHRRPWTIVPGDPASARPVAKIDGLAYGLAWLGNDGPLLTAADWFGFRALNRVDLARGEARLAGARGARFPDVGPAGEIVYENAVYSANLWLTARAGGEPRALWRSTRYSSQPEFSPDGRSIAFSSNRDGADAIYVAPLEGDPRRIAFGERQRYLRPHWSADGRSVYAVRTTTGEAGTDFHEGVRIPAQGGDPEVLAPLGRAVTDVREGGDGKLYWGERAGNAARLMRAPLDALARSERLPVPHAANHQVAGGRLALVPPQATQLLVCRLDTLACEPAAVEIPEADLYHWTLTARSVYLRRRYGPNAQLARYDLERRALAESWPVAPGGAGVSLAVAPDESRLVYSREEPPAVDLMLAR